MWFFVFQKCTRMSNIPHSPITIFQYLTMLCCFWQHLVSVFLSIGGLTLHVVHQCIEIWCETWQCNSDQVLVSDVNQWGISCINCWWILCQKSPFTKIDWMNQTGNLLCCCRYTVRLCQQCAKSLMQPGRFWSGSHFETFTISLNLHLQKSLNI